MNLSIRHWLAERHIAINQIKGFSEGQLAGIAYHIVQDMEVKSLMPFDICTLVEVLELPLNIVWEEISVISQLTEKLLRSLSQKKPLKRNEGTWLAFQIAYLQALQAILEQEASLQKPWLDRAIIPIQPHILKEDVGKFILQDPQLQGLLKTLSPGKLTDTQAEQALSSVADSLLVQQINNAAIAWLVANGAEEPEAKLLTQRLVNSLPGDILVVVTENAAPLAQLQKFFRLGISLSPNFITPEVGSTVSEKIDLHREHYRASLIKNLSIPLLMESFALKDIYIPQKGLPIEENISEQDKKTIKPVDLKTWVQKQLTDLETIAVIESEPGYGKTSFCQLWAAQVAEELYPTWMPIVIKLRDVKYGKTLIETLNSAFPVNLSTWLEQENLPCLLLLDGLDELPHSTQSIRAQAIFIQQLLNFQSQHRHKIVLTSRSKTLPEIISELPLLLRRIIIQPLDVDELKQWFQQWAKVQSLPITQNFFTFLKQAGLFTSQLKLRELSALVRQPLMLHLLGILHREGLLDDELLQLAANTQKSFLLSEIYHRLSRWLLGYPLSGGIKTMLLRSGTAHIHRTPEAIANLLAGRHPQDLLEQMQAIALKILHSQRHQINLAGEFNTLPAFYFKIWDVESSGESAAKSSLIEFSHLKLGESLCADAIAAQLKFLTQYQEEAYGTPTFVLDSPSSVAQNIYNLLGYGILSQEIEELAIAGLRRQQKHKFSFEVLFQRLLSFWRAYCQGRWLDEGIAHKALTNFHALQNLVNVEQVNAAVGMNVFLLLCTCYRETKVPFWPCGNPVNLTEFNPEVLSVLIARTTVLHKSAFATRIKSLAGLNLSGAFLSQVMLTGVNLEQTNLSNAELMGANLAGANLQQANLAGANLQYANLTGANLQQANLTGANLQQANLMGTNLNSADLTNACLFDAILATTDKKLAADNGALLSKELFQKLKHLRSLPPQASQQPFLNTVQITPNTKVNWNKIPAIGLIESCEGTILSVDLDDNIEDETVFGNNLIGE
ncbi:pentapeptide repeat-containing protein [Nostoc sp. 'Lobaria pulmonaria (5183) cyanobiont']|uniref:pentapeptide repeat-containing protein n=1 Tax=Nostoc sp. 'Lobaria pulmonaria (5183) cyanobiont' TaxID=1618022 RepID=UPI000CF355E0|nr:pentapeptide repeat-containing protein [Nostoc sp. 'Lobaria pulmonaria (5183) cyanobiont']AVH72891.1 pentapeptide repeat-containing protein [Nostoc sp. 'Lobaria pulmonaria (5183) cyanobiont']